MHHCLNVDEIVRLLACDLAASGAKATAVALACCSKSFETPVLDMLWETQDRLTPLLNCLPQEIWKEEGGVFVSHVIVLGALTTCIESPSRGSQRKRNGLTSENILEE